jgi:uncharacterized protein YjiS (DUF1127 family)
MIGAMNLDRAACYRAIATRDPGRVAVLAAAVAAALAEWRRRWRTRVDLGRMSDHELRDLGITRAEAAREAALPFWREIGRAGRPRP